MQGRSSRIPHSVRRWLPLLLAAGWIGVAGSAAAQERPGTLSLGIQGQYGLIRGASDFAEDFASGTGFAVRLRYALGGPQALGISFESQTFGPDRAVATAAEGDLPEQLKLANVTVEYLRYFNRGQGRSQYVLAGLGLYHPSEKRRGGLVPRSDGLILLSGVGTEVFFLRTTSIDLSMRGNALVGSDAFSATVEVAAGIHHYLVR